MKYKDQLSWEQYQQSLFSGAFDSIDEWDKYRVVALKELIGTGKTVIDLGSGGGCIAEEIRKMGNEVWIVDSKKAMSIAKKNFPKLHRLAGSVMNIPTKQKFDIVLASELIEHCIDLDRFFSEVKRVMKPDGEFICTSPNCSRLRNIVELIMGQTTRGFDYMYDKPIHIRFFTFHTLTNELLKNKFVITKIGSCKTPAGQVDWTKLPFTEAEKEAIEKMYERFRQDYPIKMSNKLEVLSGDLMFFVCKK